MAMDRSAITKESPRFLTFINVRYFWNEFPIGLYVYCSVLRFEGRVNVKTKMSAVVLE